jgi:6-bladed beta-propeller
MPIHSRPRWRAVLAHYVSGLALLASATPFVAQSQARWTLKETLRIGGAEAGPTSFVRTKSIAADSKGRILVYDQQTQDIKMFAPDGTFLRTIGRVGSGPGELRNAEGITIDRAGRIWVRDAANARFTVFNSEGEFDKNWPMKFCYSQGNWNPQVEARGRIIDYDCVVPQGGGRAMGQAVVAYRPDLSGVDTLGTRPECGTRELQDAAAWVRRSEKMTQFISIPFSPMPVNVLGPDGESWCAPNSSRYEIMRLFAGAKDTVRISRTVAAVPVTKAERDSIIAKFDEKGPSGLDFDRIPRAKPVIDKIYVDDQGRPWIRRTNAQGVIEFDIYRSSGQPVATVMLGKYRTSFPFVVRGDSVYMVVLDEDDVQHVVRFRIERRAID